MTDIYQGTSLVDITQRHGGQMSARRLRKKKKSYRKYKEAGDNEGKIAWKRNRALATRTF